MKIERAIERLQEIAKQCPGYTLRALDLLDGEYKPIESFTWSDGQRVVDAVPTEDEDDDGYAETDDTKPEVPDGPHEERDHGDEDHPGFDPAFLM